MDVPVYSKDETEHLNVFLPIGQVINTKVFGFSLQYLTFRINYIDTINIVNAKGD
jgi:hypothetical protein